MINLFSIALFACATCVDSTGFSQKSREAYYFITILLSSVPILVGIGIILFVRKRLKDIANEQNS